MVGNQYSYKIHNKLFSFFTFKMHFNIMNWNSSLFFLKLTLNKNVNFSYFLCLEKVTDVIIVLRWEVSGI